MQIHQITLQIPKTIFVSFDQYGSYNTDTIHLEQAAVDKAFSKPATNDTEIYKCRKKIAIVILFTKKTNSIDVGVKR